MDEDVTLDIPIPDFLLESADTIHKRMINAAPSDISTLEGDFFWDNTRPGAEEIAMLKQMIISRYLKIFFPQFSYEQYLELIGDFKGIDRKNPTTAIGIVKVEGISGVEIDKGKIFSTVSNDENNSIEFVTLEKKYIDNTGVTYVRVQCTQPGIIGNVLKGSVSVLVTPINGVSKITNEEDFTNGVDIESDDDLRERILLRDRNPSTSGNKYHYKEWALQVPGVGDAKVFPRWITKSGVKVVIVDTEKKATEQVLVDSVYNHIESVRPCGADVTVISAKEVELNIKARISIDSNISIDDAKSNFSKSLEIYLKKMIETFFDDKSTGPTYISIAKVGSILLTTDGVLDYAELTINEASSNVTIESDEIPIIGNISVEVQ